jgi:hypothetical protein
LRFALETRFQFRVNSDRSPASRPAFLQSQAQSNSSLLLEIQVMGTLGLARYMTAR